MALTAPPQRATPDPTDGIPERVQGRAVHGHPVIPAMPSHDRAQVRALLRDGIVHASPKLGLDRSQLRTQPLGVRDALQEELPRVGARTYVAQTQERESLRLPVAELRQAA